MAAPATTTPVPPFRPVSQLATRPMSWLWPARMALGKLVILDGDPGLGKSLVTLDLCARLSTGRPFPDGSPGPGASGAIVLNGEDGDEDTIRPRLQALGADLERVYVPHRAGDDLAQPLCFPSRVDVLDEALTRTRARLVVIDPIVAFLEPGIFDSSNRSVRRALLPLALLAEKHACAVLLVRHLNKRGGGRSMYRGGGAISFLGVCRSGWLIARDPLLPQRCVLAQVKNNLAPAQPSLAYAMTPHEDGPPTLAWLGETAWTADQLLAGGAPRGRPTQYDLALDFLAAFLADGPRTSRDVWTAAQEHDLSEPCHVGQGRVGMRRSFSWIARRRVFRRGGRSSLRVTGSFSVGGRSHRLANVVHERRTPTCRIRRGDPTERHGSGRPRGPTDRQGVVGPRAHNDRLGFRTLTRLRLYHPAG